MARCTTWARCCATAPSSRNSITCHASPAASGGTATLFETPPPPSGTGARPPNLGRYVGKRPELARPKPAAKKADRPYIVESEIDRVYTLTVQHFSIIETYSQHRAQLHIRTGDIRVLDDAAAWIAARDAEDEQFVLMHAARLIEV